MELCIIGLTMLSVGILIIFVELFIREFSKSEKVRWGTPWVSAICFIIMIIGVYTMYAGCLKSEKEKERIEITTNS